EHLLDRLDRRDYRAHEVCLSRCRIYGPESIGYGLGESERDDFVVEYRGPPRDRLSGGCLFEEAGDDGYVFYCGRHYSAVALGLAGALLLAIRFCAGVRLRDGRRLYVDSADGGGTIWGQFARSGDGHYSAGQYHWPDVVPAGDFRIARIFRQL